MPKATLKIEFAPQAVEGLFEIIDYCSKEFGRLVAKRVQKKILTACRKLALFPNSSPLISDPKLKELGYRTLIVSSTVVIYTHDEEAICIDGIFDSRRDYPRLFSKMKR